MEHHGENTQKNVVAIIPARYSSVRLPGKMLLRIAGTPLVLHTVERAKAAKTVDRVIVATDDKRILNAVVKSGNEAVMTSSEHRSGSDRIAEVAEGFPEGTTIVNVQGDEPLISSETIDTAVEAYLETPEIGSLGPDIVTTYEPIRSKRELLNGNNVKVVIGDSGRAIYFSRSPMPFPRHASLRYSGDPGRALDSEPELLSQFRKHTGLYVYSREYLLKFTQMPQTTLEMFESLEQLRALENGAVIKVVEGIGTSIGVDTPDDLDRVRLKIEFPSIAFRSGIFDDIPAISQVYLKSIRHSYAGFLPADYLKGLSVEERANVFIDRSKMDSYQLLVAEDKAKGVVGFIDYARPETGNYDFQGRIFSFYFLPKFQRRGLGSLLFRKCLRDMRGDCYQSVCLDTFEANPSRPFYERMKGKVVASDKHEVNETVFPTVVYGWDDLESV